MTIKILYLAVDEDGSENLFSFEPEQDFHPSFGNFYQPTTSQGSDSGNGYESKIELTTGTIEKLLGRKLSFEDGFQGIELLSLLSAGNYKKVN